MNFSDMVDSLKHYKASKIVFIGLGNYYRGDDGAGLILLKRLQKSRLFKTAVFIEAGLTPENHLAEILNSKADVVVFIDAAFWGGIPGTVSWLPEEKIAATDISTHAYSIELINKYLLNEQPELRIKILVIQPETIQPGKGLSPAVEDGVNRFFAA